MTVVDRRSCKSRSISGGWTPRVIAKRRGGKPENTHGWKSHLLMPGDNQLLHQNILSLSLSHLLISQAIIDSCTRQFPEYSERARKRIRTYLKSCRRFGYDDDDDDDGLNVQKNQ